MQEQLSAWFIEPGWQIEPVSLVYTYGEDRTENEPRTEQAAFVLVLLMTDLLFSFSPSFLPAWDIFPAGDHREVI